VHIAVDAAEVVAAALRLAAASDGARRASSAAPDVATGVTDPCLARPLAVLGDVVGDALGVLGLDLELLAGRVRAGAARYGAVEHAVEHAVAAGAAAGAGVR
jgi:hypothetical protein